MAYKINDEIFFLKIDEQVEYLTQVINEIYSKDIKIVNTNINNLSEQVNNLNETKQDKTSDELKTEVKNIVGSINELFDKIESSTIGDLDKVKKELNNKANKSDVYTKSEVNNSLNLKQDKGNYIKLNNLAAPSYVRLTTIDPVRTIVIISTRLYLDSSGIVTYTLPVTMPNTDYAVVTNNSLNNSQTDAWYHQPRIWEKTTTSVTFLNQFGANYFDCIIINIG